MFLPYNPNGRRQLVSATPPADDWHAQYGGTIGDPSSLSGGGSAQPAYGGSVTPAADPSMGPPGMIGAGSYGQPGRAMPAPSGGGYVPSGGGFRPLSQIGRGGGGPGSMALPPGATASGPAGGPGGLVLLRAPNGQTKQVAADQVAHYLARGATRG